MSTQQQQPVTAVLFSDDASTAFQKLLTIFTLLMVKIRLTKVFEEITFENTGETKFYIYIGPEVSSASGIQSRDAYVLSPGAERTFKNVRLDRIWIKTLTDDVDQELNIIGIPATEQQ